MYSVDWYEGRGYRYRWWPELKYWIHSLDTLFLGVKDRLLILRFTVIFETWTKEHIKNPPIPANRVEGGIQTGKHLTAKPYHLYYWWRHSALWTEYELTEAPVAGEPPPQVVWKKDRILLDSSFNLLPNRKEMRPQRHDKNNTEPTLLDLQIVISIHA